jgi:hypothetical protein
VKKPESVQDARMAYDKAKARDNLTTLWRLLAEQMIALGYDPGDVIATMTGVGLSFGLEFSAPDEEPSHEEGLDSRLPRAAWDFDLRHS